ncbi:hypothetical protein HI914_01147 [Erysiphe necator]|nr:hypothetical protein HI914_01147 [Erysiphe necator]
MFSLSLETFSALLSIIIHTRAEPFHTLNQQKHNSIESSVTSNKANKRVIIISFISIGAIIFTSFCCLLGAYLCYRRKLQADQQSRTIVDENYRSRAGIWMMESLDECGIAPPPYALMPRPPSYQEVQL